MFLTEQVEADVYGMKHDGKAAACWYSKLKDHEKFMSSELYKTGCGEQFAQYAHEALLGTFDRKLYRKYARQGNRDTKKCLWTKSMNAKTCFLRILVRKTLQN